MSTSETVAWATVAATVLAALVAGVIALIGVWLQIKKQGFLNSATMVTTFLDRFMSDEWRKYRLISVRNIARYRDGQDIKSSHIPILNFFENMAHLVRIKVLDTEMVWNSFGWYIERYYLATVKSPNLIEKDRLAEEEPQLWEEFE